MNQLSRNVLELNNSDAKTVH